MITDHFKSRGYQILVQRPDAAAFWMPVDGTAQFLYKDFLISMSTAGRSRGACMSPVCVFKPGNDYQDVAQDGFATVQDAIVWIDQQVDAVNVFDIINNPLRATTSTYAQALRKYFIDSDIDPSKFNSLVDRYVKQYPDIDVRTVLKSLANTHMDLKDFQLAMDIFNV